MSKEIVQITDYDVNLPLLIDQYKNKPRFVDVLESDNVQATDIETALFEIRDNYWLDTAEGVQLDVLGDIQGIVRNGLADKPYRQLIETKVVINNGSGTPEILILAIQRIFGASSVQILNVGNGVLQINANVVFTIGSSTLIEAFCPAGVEVLLTSGSNIPFGFEGDIMAFGFNSIGEDIGGELQTIVI